MERVLTQICAELHNWFCAEQRYAEYTISDGKFTALPDMVEGQYFRVVGSALNDGVYRHPAYGLQDETFDGSVWVMRIPPIVQDIAVELEQAVSDGAAGGSSPYTSESFNGYSYTRSANADGTPMTAYDAAWAAAKRKLRPWRKMP